MFLNETYITHNGLNIVFNFWQNRDTIGGSTGGGCMFIKIFRSKILREEFPLLKKRLPQLWPRSKFIAFTGGVTLQVLKQHIEDQKGV